MALELRQQLKLTQQLIMTPQLQMAIKLLQLSRLELLDTIRQELLENPALEEDAHEITIEEQVRNKQEDVQTEAPLTKEVTIEEKIREDVDWNNYLDEYSSSGKIHFQALTHTRPLMPYMADIPKVKTRQSGKSQKILINFF